MEDRLQEELAIGDFSTFDKLEESKQVEIMSKWDHSMWDKFRLQNTVSEEDVFDPIMRLIDSEIEDDEI